MHVTHRKRFVSRDLVALVVIFVRVEAVELGAQGDGLDQRCHDDVEEGVLELDALDVLFRKVGLDGLQIDALGDVGFVVGAVGVDDTAPSRSASARIRAFRSS